MTNLDSYTDEKIHEKFIEVSHWLFKHSDFRLDTHPNHQDYMDVFNMQQRLMTQLWKRNIYKIPGFNKLLEKWRQDDA